MDKQIICQHEKLHPHDRIIHFGDKCPLCEKSEKCLELLTESIKRLSTENEELKAEIRGLREGCGEIYREFKLTCDSNEVTPKLPRLKYREYVKGD